VIRSGTTPLRSEANQRPVRPKPVIISSAMNSASCSSAIDFMIGKNSGGGTMLPAVPCIGSTMIAATSPAVATFRCLRPTSAHAMPHDGYVRPTGQR